MNKKLIFALFFTSSTLTACLPTDFLYLADGGLPDRMYEPGGELADKHKGTMALANLSKEQMLQLIPVGMDKSEVVSKLGESSQGSQGSDGTSWVNYSHDFTSYKQKFSKLESINITYSAQGKVTKTDVNSSYIPH